MAEHVARTIAILVPPGAQSLDVAGPLDAFLEATRQSGGEAAYHVRLLSVGRDTLVRAGGLSILADATIYDDPGDVDTLLVAGTPDFACADQLDDVHRWLRRIVPNTHRHGSVCTGTFFLAAAGLVDGRSVTTHWQHARELARRYPAATVEYDSIYVKDGPLYTSAGVTAGIDLALALIEEDHGRELALAVARRLVVFLKRPGGQSQFSVHLAAQTAERSRMQELRRAILDDPASDLSLAALAKRTAMSERNLTRVFVREVGLTIADYVETVRVDAARRLLEQTDAPLVRIAERSGFGNADTMRRAFQRRIGSGPHDYRARFRSTH